ncbi:hypothetical protein ACIRIU_17700 [Streptomyces sp. NPDC102351]|uniref:hypothetical protein n=1 Tax=Streptomyces sp. NPDC102351 TaxID=3366158 RepID=UPI0038299EF6
MGGPLIVVPVSALPAWHGCTQSGVIAGHGRGRQRQGVRGGRLGGSDRRGRQGRPRPGPG